VGCGTPVELAVAVAEAVAVMARQRCLWANSALLPARTRRRPVDLQARQARTEEGTALDPGLVLVLVLAEEFMACPEGKEVCE
jgi:hypothetical protein